LATTLYYKVHWSGTFESAANYNAPFHAPDGDTPATYMSQRLGIDLYQGDGYSALPKYLDDGSRMWLILPEEGTSPQALLAGSTVLEDILSENLTGTYATVDLSLPKFDIACEVDLKGSLKELGITDVFDPGIADFTAIMPEEENVYLSQASHAVRVAVDEDGITAAAYTIIMKEECAADVEEVVAFTLDRPFIFLIESQDGLPLFCGIVSNP